MDPYKQIDNAISRLDVTELEGLKGSVGDAGMIQRCLHLMSFKLIKYNAVYYPGSDVFTVETARRALNAVLDLGIPDTIQRDQLDLSPWEALEIVENRLTSLYDMRTPSLVESREIDPAAVDWSCGVCLMALPPRDPRYFVNDGNDFMLERDGCTPLLHAVREGMMGQHTVEALLNRRGNFSDAEWESGRAMYYTAITDNISTMAAVMIQLDWCIPSVINNNFSFGSAEFNASNVLAQCCRIAPAGEIEKRMELLLDAGADPRSPGVEEILRVRCPAALQLLKLHEGMASVSLGDSR